MSSVTAGCRGYIGRHIDKLLPEEHAGMICLEYDAEDLHWAIVDGELIFAETAEIVDIIWESMGAAGEHDS